MLADNLPRGVHGVVERAEDWLSAPSVSFRELVQPSRARHTVCLQKQPRTNKPLMVAKKLSRHGVLLVRTLRPAFKSRVVAQDFHVSERLSQRLFNAFSVRAAGMNHQA